MQCSIMQQQDTILFRKCNDVSICRSRTHLSSVGSGCSTSPNDSGKIRRVDGLAANNTWVRGSAVGRDVGVYPGDGGQKHIYI